MTRVSHPSVVPPSRPLRAVRCLLALSVLALVSSVAAVPDRAPAAEAGDYRIAPRDQLQFQIFEEEDSALVQRVSSAGEISVPLLGAIKVAGRTLRECESLIEKRYREEGYFLRPQVILSFQAYAPRSVSVLGQVNNPNQIDFAIERGAIGIVAAITRAGGFTRIARTDAVRVMRTVNGKETSFTVNVSAYLDDKSKEQEFQLMPDDIIFVPERVF
jgi:protein involved in polysaccharide export with SLBB domain